MENSESNNEIRRFKRAYVYYTTIIQQLLREEFRNNDFGYLPYYITRLQLNISQFITNINTSKQEFLADLLNEPNIIGWYFILNGLEKSDNELLLDTIQEFSSFPDGIYYLVDEAKVDILAMLDLIVNRINRENSKIEIKSPPKFHDLRNKASSILIRSNRNVPDQVDLSSFIDINKSFSVKNLKQIIEDRRCCLMNGKNGDQYCNICGKIIPDEYKVEN